MKPTTLQYINLTSQTYSLPSLGLAFVGFSCISSITYIINDWMDREQDRLHPIKKHRPLAAGLISGRQAIGVSIVLAAVVAIATFFLGWFYGIIVLTYFVLTNLYSLGLKNLPILDILLIAINFALRMMAGMSSFPDASTLPYFGLLIGIIFIFLTHKRRSDIKMLKEHAIEHKLVLKFYTKRNNYLCRFLAYVLVFYCLYLLWQSGLAIHKAAGLYLQLFVTSFVFSRHPEYTSEPQYLFREVVWGGVLLGNVVVWVWF